MNLELIRKYEKEFLHMLHGGKLKYFTGKEWLSYSGVELWTASNDLKIIIDDQFEELELALAKQTEITRFLQEENLRLRKKYNNLLVFGVVASNERLKTTYDIRLN